MRYIAFILLLSFLASCGKLRSNKTEVFVHVEDRTSSHNLEGYRITLHEGKSSISGGSSTIVQEAFLDENNQCFFRFDAKNGEAWGYEIRFDPLLDMWGVRGVSSVWDTEFNKSIQLKESASITKGKPQVQELVMIPSADLQVWINNREVFDLNDYCHLKIKHEHFEYELEHQGEGITPATHIAAFLGEYDVEYFTVINGDTSHFTDSFFLEHNDSFDYELIY